MKARPTVPRRPVCITIDSQLWHEFGIVASTYGTTKSGVIEDLLAGYLDDYRHKALPAGQTTIAIEEPLAPRVAS